jgi:2-polyprenyl-3-methyl-5-hydroxy-6-metoxy-1,4-benzoquinol methylase
MSSSDANTNRWQKEVDFFDADASNAAKTIGPIDPLALARYSSPRLKRRFTKEFQFRLLGDVKGRSILDVGCGYGSNAVLLAKLGATVTGIDISPKSIELAKKRREINGVANSVELYCSPLETARIPGRTFDIIWGDNILHHLIDDLDTLLANLVQLTRPGGLLVFNEPVNLNHRLRRIRLMLPIYTDATPDERPLEQREIEILRRHIPQLRLRFFDLFGRLNRFVLSEYNYERSSAPRRFLSNVLASVDWPMLTIPGLRNLAGRAVLWGYIDKT